MQVLNWTLLGKWQNWLTILLIVCLGSFALQSACNFVFSKPSE